MRYLAGLGAIAFTYLSLIPITLVGSTLDPACSGDGCQTGLISDIVFTGLYGTCALGLLSIAGTLGLYAVRPAVLGERWIVRALLGTVVALGLTLLALFAVTAPIAATIVVAIGAGTYLGLRRLRDAQEPPDPSSNGHHPELNGKGRLNGSSRGPSAP